MSEEIEIKLRVADKREFLRKLRKLGVAVGAAGKARRVHEHNIIFDTPDGGLAKRGQLLRIRTESPASPHTRRKPAANRHVVTFKQPPASERDGGPARGRHKVREETELEVQDPASLMKILGGLGLRGWFRYEKHRTTYTLPAGQKWAHGLLIELDETPVGVFVELEGPATAIDHAASLLGYAQRDYITKNYLVLYMEECRRRGEQPTNMLFREKS